MSDDEVTCIICNVSEGEHNARHAFTPPGTRVDTAQFGRKRRKTPVEGDTTPAPVPTSYSVSQTPFDPVLRQALIDKGVLTIEDLDAARRKIELLTNQVMSGVAQMPPLQGESDGSR